MDTLQASVLELQPGEIIQFDFRSEKTKTYFSTNCFDRIGQPLKVISWNIERGIQLDAIIAQLRSIDADIIALQEIDSWCSRSNFIDTGIAIARALELNYAFQLEFRELGSGKADYQPYYHGVHGNGILTKFDIHNAETLDHKCQPYNWDRDGVLLNEPREGRRFSLCCTLRVPAVYSLQYCQDLRHSDLVPGRTTVVPRHFHVSVYTCHMELFCGASDRLAIIAELFTHARAAATQYQMLLGDFNTLAHSLARLSDKYCRDGLRWGSLGWTEAQWLCAHVLDYGYDDALEALAATNGALVEAALEEARVQRETQTLLTASGPAAARTVASASVELLSRETDADDTADPQPPSTRVQVQQLLGNTRVRAAAQAAGCSLSAETVQGLVNPGFIEVWEDDVETLTNYRGWFYGKLDYTLTRGLAVVDRHIYNRDYSASDHRLLYIAGFLDARHLHTAGRLYYAAIEGQNVHPDPDMDADADALSAVQAQAGLQAAEAADTTDATIAGVSEDASRAQASRTALVSRMGGGKGGSSATQVPVLSLAGQRLRFSLPTPPAGASRADWSRWGYRTPTSCNMTDAFEFGDAVAGAEGERDNAASRERVLTINAHGAKVTLPCARMTVHARGADVEFEVLPCRVRGAANAHAGVKGWIRRNLTPFARQVLVILLVLLMLFDLLLL